MAQLTWKLVDLSSSYDDISSFTLVADISRNSTEENSNEIAIIKTNQLFGGADKSRVSKIKKIFTTKKLKKTKLDLRLTGLIKGEFSVAVIVFKGKQGSYIPGEYIIKSKSLTVQLDIVYINYVIIINNGVKEPLYLPKLNTKTLEQTGIISTSAVTSFAEPQRITLDLNSAAIKGGLDTNPSNTNTTNPLSLSNLLKINPNIVQGKLTGYKIAAGQDNRLLASTSIQVGDIITHVKGRAVAQPPLPSIHQMLQSKGTFSITIDRSGTIITMDIKL